MDAFERRTPHYLRIYRDLKQKILEASFAPSEKLPTQRDLASTYGVTVMTVRQALQLLEQEELVVMQHGLGTFVAPQRVRYAIGNLRSLAQEMAAQGLELQTRVLKREYVEPHPRVAELLRLDAGEPVLALERLRFVGVQPLVYQQSHIHPIHAEALVDVDLSEISLYDYLHEQLHVEIAHAQERLHAVSLSPHQATLLEEAPGSAALLSERITFSVNEEPIIFDRAFMPGDRVSLATDRFVSDITVGYELRLSEEGE